MWSSLVLLCGQHFERKKNLTSFFNSIFLPFSFVQVSSKSHFVNDLGLDSLDVVEIVMALEDEFGIEISDEEAEKVFTVEDAVEFISKAQDIH